MLRRLTGGACGPLLAGCVLVAVVWAGSYRSSAAVRFPVAEGGTRWQIVSYRGLLGVSATLNYPAAENARVAIRASSRARTARWDATYWNDSYLGFSAEEGFTAATDANGIAISCRWSSMMFPYWLIFSLLALVPVSVICRTVQARWRTSHGRCGQCGYECGEIQCPACAARSAVIALSPRTHLVRTA